MPYFVFHNMSAYDADSVAAYIYQLTPAGTAQPARQPLPAPARILPLPIPPQSAAKIPDTTLPTTDPNYEKAVLGKYMASGVGICVECHTERVQQTQELDATKFFGGGEAFVVGGPFGTVTAANITPDKSGIARLDAAKRSDRDLDRGRPRTAAGICPPMPAGPRGAFGGMDPAQALAIGYYLTSDPPA